MGTPMMSNAGFPINEPIPALTPVPTITWLMIDLGVSAADLAIRTTIPPGIADVASVALSSLVAYSTAASRMKFSLLSSAIVSSSITMMASSPSYEESAF
jgi:hypothetical protein